MRYKKVLLIVNPFSRRFSESILKTVTDNIKKRGIDPVVEIIGEYKNCNNIEDYDLVPVYGGDAAVNFAVNLLAGKKPALLVLPCGTSDVFALEAGIPRDPVKALQLIDGGVEKRITLGNANGHYFVQMAGIGLDATAVRMVDERLKRLAGKFAYIASALGCLKSNDRKIEFIVDDRKIEGYSAVIGNGRRYGGWFSATPDADLFSDTLDVVIFKKRFVLKYMVAIMLSKRSKDALYLKAKNIIINQSGADVHVDGDWIGKTPFSIRAEPKSLTVLMPKLIG